MTIVVGMMTYVVDDPGAAEVLQMASHEAKIGNLGRAQDLKISAARIENGTMTYKEWQQSEIEHTPAFQIPSQSGAPVFANV